MTRKKDQFLDQFKGLIPEPFTESTDPAIFRYQVIDHDEKLITFRVTLQGVNLNHSATINPQGCFSPCRPLLLQGYKVKGI